MSISNQRSDLSSVRNISGKITYTNINLITSSRVHGVFCIGKDTGRWRGDLKVDGDLASNCDLLAEFQLTLPES